MKPFNLEAAKAGAKLVTRGGREVTEFHYFETSKGQFPVTAVVDGCITTYMKSGREYGDDSPINDSMDDLFMAPVTRTVYVNLYPGIAPGTMGGKGAYHYGAEKDAQDAASSYVIAVAVPVTISE